MVHLIRYWYWFVMLFLFVLTLVLSHLLKSANKENGELEHRLEISKAAVKILGKQVSDRDIKITELSNDNALAFEQCQATAASSDSTAFTKGVEVGKVIGAKKCTEQSSSQPSPSASAPATPPAKTQ